MTHLDTEQLVVLFGQGFLPQARVEPSHENELAVAWLRKKPSLGEPEQILAAKHVDAQTFVYLFDQFSIFASNMKPLDLNAYQRKLLKKVM